MSIWTKSELEFLKENKYITSYLKGENKVSNLKKIKSELDNKRFPGDSILKIILVLVSEFSNNDFYVFIRAIFYDGDDDEPSNRLASILVSVDLGGDRGMDLIPLVELSGDSMVNGSTELEIIEEIILILYEYLVNGNNPAKFTELEYGIRPGSLQSMGNRLKKILEKYKRGTELY